MIKNELIKQIKKDNKGISLEKFIDISLFNKNGYYIQSNPIGKSGDFITAPEISQLFGEIIGLYIYDIWKKKFNNKINLIEIGPGKGTLILDILRITKKFSYFHKCINLNLIEINKQLIDLQKKNLSNSIFKNKKISWHKNIEKIDDSPSIIIANEFFDCLPISQFVKNEKKWEEKRIGFNQEKKLFFFKNYKIDNKRSNKIDKILNNNNHKILEVSKKREDYFDKLCKYIKRNKGVLIIFDYGYEKQLNYSTLQCVKNNKKVHLFDDPGNQDITSLVDFNSFTELTKKNNLNINFFSYQKDFLISNGIIERKNIILEKCDANQKYIIETGLKRLIDDDKMGKLFKCLIISDKKLNEK